MSIKVTQVGVLVLRARSKNLFADARSYLFVAGGSACGFDIPLSATSVFSATAGASNNAATTWLHVGTHSSLVLSGVAYEAALFAVHGLALSTATFSAHASSTRDVHLLAFGAVDMIPNAAGGRDIYVHAETSMGFSPDTGPDEGILGADAASMAFLHAQAEVVTGKFGASSMVEIASRADAELLTSEELLIPGGDMSNGMLEVLASGTSGDFPYSFAETSRGVVIMANGIDPMLRWDGLASDATRAGAPNPDSGATIAGSGDGLIIGRRWAYCRYVDHFGNYSNLSPVAGPVDLGRASWIGVISAGADGVPACTSESHGLSTGDVVSIFGVTDLPIVGKHPVRVLDGDTFSLDGIVCEPGGTTSRPGYWVKGAASVVYSGCPVPTDPRVARRQILRNLEGNAEVFYVDVDTADLASDAFSSTLDDDALSSGEAVPIRYDDEMPAASRFGVPPSHKGVVEYHLGRVFAGVDRPYSLGHSEVSLGSRIVKGVGTNWTQSMAGRSFFAEGSTRPHYVDRVLDPRFLALDAPFSGPSSKFCRYSIRPSNQERRLVYYSEPNLPEAWPAWNAFAVPEHGDEITGLMVMRSYLYIIEKRHISSFTFKADPGKDGFIFLRSHRGCVNDRCHVLVEDVAYMLDEAGVHSFDGESSTHLSARISNVFNDPNYPYRVDWKSPNAMLWHGVQDPTAETVRWFIDFVGKPRLTHALCYDYRRDRWWIEQYPEAVASSCLATIGYRRVLAGTTARRVIALGEGTLDGIDGMVYGSLGGTVSLASDTTMTAEPSDPPLPLNLAGVPITITSGPAKGQVGIVVASLSGRTLEFWHQWPVKPGPGDTFQVGGVNWSWRNGWLPFLDEETDNARDIGVVFKPTVSGGAFDVRLFYDYGETPRAWGVERSVDGITTRAGSPDININTDKVRGYAIQRMQSRREAYSQSDYFLSVELAGTQGVEPSRIFEVTVDGVFSQSRR